MLLLLQSSLTRRQELASSEMERYRCKICLKSFGNGRALGGHMRSHMLYLPKPEDPEPGPPVQLGKETDWASSSSSEEGGEREEKEQCYGLRENPKRSFRLVDPEFSFAVDAGSVVLQDSDESETESSKNPTRRRSKRIRKPEHQHRRHSQKQEQDNTNKVRFNYQASKTESSAEPGPASSISGVTTDEDVAFCLMMLSNDKWKKKEKEEEEFHETEKDSVDETDDDSEDFKLSKNQSRGNFRCESCKKVFKSYQALGGHRANHKKNRVHSPAELEQENVGTSSASDKKVHECPVCFRVFSSGQALGGHKRSHVIGRAAVTIAARSSTNSGDRMIDLNLPAPTDQEDDFSQAELSAVSDAEFVNERDDKV